MIVLKYLKINYLSIFGLCPEIKNVFLDLELISGQHNADQNLPTLFWMVQKKSSDQYC